MPNTLLELDHRRRASFGRIGRKEHSRYLVEEREDGTLVLTPAVVMTQREAEILANPSRIASIKKGIAEAHAGLARPVDLSELEAADDTEAEPPAKTHGNTATGLRRTPTRTGGRVLSGRS